MQMQMSATPSDNVTQRRLRDNGVAQALFPCKLSTEGRVRIGARPIRPFGEETMC